MATKEDLRDWVVEAVDANGGSGTIVDVAEHVWTHHEADLRDSGRLFFTWQYDMRWCALELRKAGRLKPADQSPQGTWERR